MNLNHEQQAMLSGERGVAKQMAMRLVLDMAAAAGATELIPIESAHLSGVSPLTGGLGLRQFLAKLARDPLAQVAVPTTLNSAGCDEEQFAEMRIVAPDFLAHNHEIVALYTQIGVQPTQSCIPYEWEGVVTEGVAAWAESNAVCFGNSYCDLLTNRESGLSALACALTGYTPKYGFLVGQNRPNLHVKVTASLDDPTDFSILGDWFGTQRKPHWNMPLGPIPLISGLPDTLTHEQRKALTAAAANYGCPKLFIESDQHPADVYTADFQDSLHFSEFTLANRYANLAPTSPPALIVIGCPQASIGELRAVADLLRNKQVVTSPHSASPILWVFTSSANRAIAEQTGIAQIITQSGALLLANTCPEVVPYDQSWVSHILTNSMKAEHYIKSGLNGIPTSVMSLRDCIGYAIAPTTTRNLTANYKADSVPSTHHSPPATRDLPPATHPFSALGEGLPSQGDFCFSAETFVTDTPITLLGFVNRITGVIEEEGHPRNGESMAGKIAIFPKGSGSTVAPYVLLELFYRGNAPLAILNTEIDQQCAPACSLENIPYAYNFDSDIIANINHGDTIELSRKNNVIELRVARGE